LDDLGAGFEIAKGYRIGHALEVNLPEPYWTRRFILTVPLDDLGVGFKVTKGYFIWDG
jgi:hypothetical protein